MNAQKLAQLKANVRIGGKGSVRRKKKVRRAKPGQTDDKKLQASLQKLGVQPMQGIEEVNLFKDDGSVIHFANPRFQIAAGANMYVVSGRAEQKSIQDILPGLLKTTGLTGDKTEDDVPDLVENFDE